MTTFADVGREVVASVVTDTSALLVAQWAAQRYVQLASRTRFRHLRKRGEVIVPGALSAGTVTTTRDSRAVFLDTMAQASLTNIIEERYFRTHTTWYKIERFNGTYFTLSSPFSENGGSLVAYRIVPRYVALHPSVRFLGDVFVNMRLRRPLDRLSQTQLDSLFPERTLVGSPISYWSEAGVALDANGLQCKVIEFYPYDTYDELMSFVYWEEPSVHAPDDEIPKGVDSFTLGEGALINLYRSEMTKALQAGKADIAGTWRNEARAQETAWERRISEAIRNDRGTDDITFILQLADYGLARDIKTGRDEVFLRGNNP